MLMFIQNFKGTINQVLFTTVEQMDTKQAKEYALQKLKNGGYKNCTIEKVFVNGELILENVKLLDI